MSDSCKHLTLVKRGRSKSSEPGGRAAVARNIIANYGRGSVRRLTEAFAAGESGQALAREFGVSRSRVNQWKKALGYEVRTYVVADVVEHLLREQS